MTPPADAPPTLRFTRDFHAPPELVFRAWTRAEHVCRWFAPEPLTVPEAKIEARVGGAWNVTMRMPGGELHRMEGEVLEIAPPHRLAIRMRIFDDAGATLFTAHTTAQFRHGPSGGTRLDIEQTYDLVDLERAAPMVGGAEAGWRSSLDNLGREVARLLAEVQPAAPVVHGAFTVARTYAHPPERLWRALTETEAKARWFAGPGSGFETLERSLDLRQGGEETVTGRWADGTVTRYRATYFDITPRSRLVYAYELSLNGRKISVSLATVEITAEGAGTRLSITEQGAFLDGYEDGGAREQGTAGLLETLAASLDEEGE